MKDISERHFKCWGELCGCQPRGKKPSFLAFPFRKRLGANAPGHVPNHILESLIVSGQTFTILGHLIDFGRNGGQVILVLQGQPGLESQIST